MCQREHISGSMLVCRENELDADAEYDVDGGLDMYESRKKKGTKVFLATGKCTCRIACMFCFMLTVLMNATTWVLPCRVQERSKQCYTRDVILDLMCSEAVMLHTVATTG